MLNLDQRIKSLEALRKDRAGDSDAEILSRAQSQDGFDLSLIPGDSVEEKLRAVQAAYWGKLQLSPEARHAARDWFEVLEKF